MNLQQMKVVDVLQYLTGEADFEAGKKRAIQKAKDTLGEEAEGVEDNFLMLWGMQYLEAEKQDTKLH